MERKKASVGRCWAKGRSIVRMQNPRGCWEERDIRAKDERHLFPGRGLHKEGWCSGNGCWGRFPCANYV